MYQNILKTEYFLEATYKLMAKEGTQISSDRKIQEKR